MCTKVEGTGGLPLGEFTGRNGRLSQTKYVCVYPVSEVSGYYTGNSVYESTYYYCYAHLANATLQAVKHYNNIIVCMFRDYLYFQHFHKRTE